GWRWAWWHGLRACRDGDARGTRGLPRRRGYRPSLPMLPVLSFPGGGERNRRQSSALRESVAMSQKKNGFKVMGGWRVGVPPEESVPKSGLLVPVGTRDGNDALTLIDVSTGQRFWAVP